MIIQIKYFVMSELTLCNLSRVFMYLDFVFELFLNKMKATIQLFN